MGGQFVRAAGLGAFGNGLVFVSQDADLTGLGTEVGGITGPQQQAAVLVGGGLAAPVAGKLVGSGEVGIFIGGDQRGCDVGKAHAQCQPHGGHQQKQRGLEHCQQHRRKDGGGQRLLQPCSQQCGPVGCKIADALHCHGSVQRFAVGQRKRHAVHFALAGPDAQRAVPGDLVIQADGQRFVVVGDVGVVAGELRKGIVPDIQEVARREKHLLPGFVVDFDHRHAGFVKLPVGAELEPYPVKRLSGLQRHFLGQTFLGDVDDLAVFVVDDRIAGRVAQAFLQVIPYPAAQHDGAISRQCGRCQAAHHPQELFVVLHRVPAFL